MDTTYNKVNPVSLGQNRRNGDTKKRKRDNKKTGDVNVPKPPSFPPNTAPVPPPPAFPPTHIPSVSEPRRPGNSSVQPWNSSIQGNPPVGGLPGIPAVNSFYFNNGMAMNSNNNAGYVVPRPETSQTISPAPGPFPNVYESGFVHMGFPAQWNGATINGPGQATGFSHRSSAVGNGKSRRSSKLNGKKKGSIGDNSMSSVEEIERRRKRAERFSNVQSSRSSTNLDEEENYANLNAISTKSHRYDKNKRIVGCCQSLEKSYLRLTSEPNPDLVRPLNVLKKTYAMLIKKHQKRQASYQYLCDQFKSVRQDLRVQMIENQFAVKVYESHARIALENGDIGEFNQCQSRLITLFELPNVKPSCLEEFTSYRVLYYMLTEDNGSINTLRLKLMTKNQAVFKNSLVQTAFALAHARLIGDYHQFMRMYSELKTLGKKLVDAFIEKEKLKSLVVICKSYNQVKLDFLIKELQFRNESELKEFFNRTNLLKYVVTKNASADNEFQYLDTRACRFPILQHYSNSKKIDIKGQQ